MANKNHLSQEQRAQRGGDEVGSANDFLLDEVPVERHDVVIPESSHISDQEDLPAQSGTQGDDFSIEGRETAETTGGDNNPLETQDGVAASAGDSSAGSSGNSTGSAARAFQSQQTETSQEQSSAIQFTEQGNSGDAGLSPRAESTTGESASQSQGSVTATPADEAGNSQLQSEGDPAPVINLGPTDIEYVGGSIAENAVAGSVVANLSAVDPDDEAGFVFEITDDPSGNFEVVGNEIRVKAGASLDAETTQSHSVTVQVTDSAGNTYSEVLTINVGDVDEFDVGAVGDGNGAANTVSENTAVGSTVGITASASDADVTNSSVTYSLSDDAGGLFAIDANTGVVTVAGALDAEAAQSQTIEVTATSSDGSTSTQSYTINVSDVDEFDVSTPVDGDAGANAISEDAAAGSTVGVTASASDADATNSGVTYSVDDARFTVDADGTVRVAAGASFDTESEASIDIVVTATSADGSASNETFSINVSDVDETISGTAGDDVITDSGDAGDTLLGLAGDDHLIGDTGNNTLDGGTGADLLQGGQGDDTFNLTADSTWSGSYVAHNVQTGENVSLSGKNQFTDHIAGGEGNDTLVGTDQNDAIFLDDGISANHADASGARIESVENFQLGAGDDILDMTSNQYIYTTDMNVDGGSGNDTIWAGSGDDTIDGGIGSDSIDGGAGDDTLHGGDGDDELEGSSGNDTLYGGAGNDEIEGGSGDDTLHGGDGDDELEGSSGNDTLYGGAGNDEIEGGAGDDILFGGTGNDTLEGDAGSDMFIFQMSDGTDTIHGGAGGGWTDSIQLQDANGGGNLGTYGVDWTVTLDSGSIDSINADSIELSDDAAGTIDLSDGSTINFFEIERIDF